MANGTPLTDLDRAPWLAALHALISTSLEENRPAGLVCSALKDNEGVQLVYLKGSYELIWSRVSLRNDHYMKPNMLKSQFETREEPTNALTFDVSMPVDEMVQGLIASLSA